MRRLKLLAILAGVMMMMFALTLGSASADGGHYVGGDEADGINNAAGNGAYAPAGSPTGSGDPGEPGRDGIDTGTASDGGGISNNPLCPLNDGNSH